MDVAIKYCGGCNPKFDRAGLARRLAGEFPDARFFPLREGNGEEADLVLVVCGCPTACASHGHLSGKHGKALIAGEGDFARVRSRIGSIMSG